MSHETLSVMEVNQRDIRLPFFRPPESLGMQSFTVEAASFTFAKQEEVYEENAILWGISQYTGRRHSDLLRPRGSISGLTLWNRDHSRRSKA